MQLSITYQHVFWWLHGMLTYLRVYVFTCFGILVFWCFGVLVFWYFGVLVFWSNKRTAYSKQRTANSVQRGAYSKRRTAYSKQRPITSATPACGHTPHGSRGRHDGFAEEKFQDLPSRG